MPPSEDDKDSVREEFDQKLVAVMEAQKKLRDRLASVQLDPDEAFEIKTLLLQLDMKGDETIRDREAFEEGRLAIQPPSDAALEEMAARIKEIRDINVKNKKASDVIVALTKVAGKLPKSG